MTTKLIYYRSKCINDKAAPVKYCPARPGLRTGSCSGLFATDSEASHVFTEPVSGWMACSGLPPQEAPVMIAEKRKLFFSSGWLNE